MVKKKGGLTTMKWELSSIDRYIEAKEYIDTALVPLIQIKLDGHLKQTVADSTWVMGVAECIEEQLVGRVMLFPPFSSIELEDEVHLISSLNTYAMHVHQHGFENVIFLTHKDSWNTMANLLEANVLYIPRETADTLDISTEEMNDYAHDMIPRLIEFWKKG